MDTSRSAITAASYDAVADEYEAVASGRSPEGSAFFERFCALLPSGSVVGDVGCGPGHDVADLRRGGHCVIGIDRSPAIATLASRHAPAVVADLRSMPFRSASFDGLWSSASMLHVDRVDIPALLDDWIRMLRPGGLLGLSTSVGNDEGWELAPAAPAQVPTGSIDHRRWFVHHDPTQLSAQIEASGFTVVEESVRPSFRDWLQMLCVAP
jgi:SAM-dependent methyltransferase